MALRWYCWYLRSYSSRSAPVVPSRALNVDASTRKMLPSPNTCFLSLRQRGPPPSGTGKGQEGGREGGTHWSRKLGAAITRIVVAGVLAAMYRFNFLSRGFVGGIVPLVYCASSPDLRLIARWSLYWCV